MKGLRLGYLYRDASNYKFRGEVLLSGSVAESEIRRYLIDGEYFVPGTVGLQSLVPEDTNEDDHQLHEIEFIGQELIPTESARPAEGFVNALRYASHKGWFNG